MIHGPYVRHLTDKDRARDFAFQLRHAADTVELIPEYYTAYRRGDMDFATLMDELFSYEDDDVEIMSELIAEYGMPPGEPPHEPPYADSYDHDDEDDEDDLAVA